MAQRVGKNKQETGVEDTPAQTKTASFFEKNYALFFAPVIALVAYLVALFSYGVWPFGGEYTAASYDLSAQICPFVEHLFDVIDGKSSLAYSYAIAGGADVTGTFLYFFVSPFSFLFLLCGDGRVAQASSIVMALKLASIAFAGTWFAKKLFKSIPDILCILIGVTYAYCGYTFVANTYIVWLDFLIYMPFCVWAFKHMLRTGRVLWFSLLLACCIYTCFSIACFSMFTVFPLLALYAFFCVPNGKRKTYIATLCLAFFFAILLALPVLFPAFSAYLQSGRGGGLFENFWRGFERNDGTLGAFDSSAFLESWGNSLYAKWSYILSDAAFLTLTIVWFFRRGLKDPFAKFMLVCGIATLLPALVDEAMLLMNMGSYMSYALRFGFLNALYFLGGACLALEGICYAPKTAYDGTPLLTLRGTPLLCEYAQTPCDLENDGGRYAMKIKKRPVMSEKTAGGILLFLGAVAIGFLLWFISAEHYKTIWVDLVSDSEIKEGLSTFSSRYAHSLGGAEVTAVLFGVVVIVLTVGCVFVWHKKVSPRFLSWILLFIVGVQVLFYNNQLVLGNRSVGHTNARAYQEIAQTLNERDEGYFRVKDYADAFTANIPFTGNTNSFSVFSSVIDRDNFVVHNLFGYSGNGKNSLKSAHSSVKYNRSDEFGDAFLGYKYFVVPKSKKEQADRDGKLQKYLKPYMVKDETGGEIQLCKGEYYVYENEIVFPLGYKVSSGEYTFDYPNEANPTNRKYNQQKLYEFLRGKSLSEMQNVTGSSSPQFVTVETARELSEYLSSRAANVEVSKARITATVTAGAGEYLFLNFVASKGYKVYVNGSERKLIDNDVKFLMVELDEGENTVEFVYKSPYVQCAWIGVFCGAVLLAGAIAVVKRTKFMQIASPYIATAGVMLAIALLAFFFLFPTAVWIVKLVYLLL